MSEEINSEVKMAAFHMHVAGQKPPAILTALDLDPKFQNMKKPSLRTVQSWTASAEWSPEVDTQRWGLADAKGDEAPIVLETLAGVIEETAGKVSSLSRVEACWIVRVARAAPDLSPWQRYVFARSYIGQMAAKESTANLDLTLAFAPWRDTADRLARAGARHWLPRGTYIGPYPGKWHKRPASLADAGFTEEAMT
jgi:hypothetical protein